MVNNMKPSASKTIQTLLAVAVLIMGVDSLQIHPKDIILGLDDAALQQLESDVSLQSEEEQTRQRMQNDWLWNQYLASTPDDTSNHYHYDQQANKIVFSQEELEQQAIKADETFAQRQKLLQVGNKGLSQEKAQLEQAIDQMRGQSTAQLQSNYTQEQIEQDLSQTEAALDAVENNITATKKRVLHIIPHSHTDIGWLNTPEQSFSGFAEESNNSSPYTGGVKDILDSVYEQLVKNDTRTFTYAETKFFKMWFENQTAEVQEKAKGLVKDGRLDLVNGGWSSPDEAVTTYDALIDNFMVGQQWLYKTFDHHSKISWQVDALGVSSGYARLAKDVGFDMMYYSKVNLAERKEMRKNRTRTQVWRPHEENLGKRKDILSVTVDSQKNSSLGSYCWPQGFWVDQNYLQDVPMILKKNQTGYKFDKLVKGLYEEVSEYLANERTEHVFRPFGCDMAYVDAEMNYIITDQLMATWKELGYGDDIEIKYSTPTTYLTQMKAVNQEWTDEAPHAGWPIRRDGTFPYGSAPDVYQNGFYSSRPQLKKDIRRVSQQLHSSQRLIAQQVLKVEATEADVQEVIDFQLETLDNLGTLQHNGVMGTTPTDVAANYSAKALDTRKKIHEMNAKFLVKSLGESLNISLSAADIDSDLGFEATEKNYTSLYQSEDQLMFIVQNPTQQMREERVEIQVPYHNYTVWEYSNGALVEVKTFDKYLPRVWRNSNVTLVPSFCTVPVNFSNTYEIAKVFLVKNSGFQSEKNAFKPNHTGQPAPWNLNLPSFKQVGAHDIHNYPSNYKKLKPKANISAGNKTLTFLEVRKAKGVSATSLEKSFFQEDQILAQKANVGKGKAKAAKSKKKGGDENSGAAIFQYYDNSTGISQKFAFNLRYYVGAYYDKSKEKNLTANTTSGQYPNATYTQQDHRSDGMYEFSVNGTNGTQASLKYGNIAVKKSKFRQNKNSSEILLVWEQGYSKVGAKLFNASANSSANASSGAGGAKSGGNSTKDKEMLLQSVNSTHPLDTNSSFKPPDKVRAAARITLSDNSEFLKFEVTINDVAVALDPAGKDVVVDWYMLDNFDSGKRFWADANGLEMVPQQLFQHRDYNYTSNNTISANYYPVTSAIAIRDMNSSNKPALTANKSEGANSTSNVTLAALGKLPSFTGRKQVTIMNDRSQGGSAGLRGGKNIEFMQHRRFKKQDNYGVNEPLNELDKKGRGVQVKATYWMQISDSTGKFANSTQRANQRAQDQPLLVYFAKNFSLPAGNTYPVKEEANLTLIQDIHSLLEKQPSVGAEGSTPDFGGETAVPNKIYKESKTLKTLVYAQGLNQISLRVINLEDHFDKSSEESQQFDVNGWAREFYLEANNMNSTLLKELKIEITEMNLGGSIEKALLKHDNQGSKFAQTKWKTDAKYDPKNPPQKPVDFVQNFTLPISMGQSSPPLNETNYLVNLEPQRIRVFNIKYLHGSGAWANATKAEAPARAEGQAAAGNKTQVNSNQSLSSHSSVIITQLNKTTINDQSSSKLKSNIVNITIENKPAAVAQKEIKALKVNALSTKLSNIEDSLQNLDFNQFTAKSMKTASQHKAEQRMMSPEELQSIIDNTTVQVQH